LRAQSAPATVGLHVVALHVSYLRSTHRFEAVGHDGHRRARRRHHR
jgi:hypothetical protein